MIFNYKVYRANDARKHAHNVWEHQKHIVIDENIEAEHGNRADRIFYERHPEIKTTWQVRKTTISK